MAPVLMAANHRPRRVRALATRTVFTHADDEVARLVDAGTLTPERRGTADHARHDVLQRGVNGQVDRHSFLAQRGLDVLRGNRARADEDEDTGRRGQASEAAKDRMKASARSVDPELEKMNGHDARQHRASRGPEGGTEVAPHNCGDISTLGG